MTDPQGYFDRVAGIADIVRADADQAERDRRLGDKTVDALRSTGLLRMMLPARYGGGELLLADTFPIVEAMARVNGSAGWNLNIGATTASLAADLADDATRDRVLGDEQATVAGTINFINIKARRVDGGVVFDGPATFLSGSSHASWLVIGGLLHEDDKPVFARGGIPHILRGVIPIDAVEVRDTWHVSGMRATASNDATLDGVFVPDDFLCSPEGTGLISGDPAARLPLFSRFGNGLAFVGLGTARGALDALITVAAEKVPVGGSQPLRERGDVQTDVTHAIAFIESGHAFLRRVWDASEVKLRSGPLDVDDQVMLRLAYVTAAQYAANAAEIAYHAGGSSSLYEKDGIERCWRDALAVTKHIAVSARSYERLGRILLGLKPLPGPI